MGLTNRQLMGAAAAVMLLFIAGGVLMSVKAPRHFIPDRSYQMPAGWPYRGLVPPRGAVPAVHEPFRAISPFDKGHSFSTTEDRIVKQGVCFSLDASREEMLAYFDELLRSTGFMEQHHSAGRSSDSGAVAVWNEEEGLLSVILLRVDGKWILQTNMKDLPIRRR